MPRLNSTGSAVMGIGAGTISIDGSTPPALSGRVGGASCWLSDTLVAYQDGVTGAGPWTLKTYNTSTMALADLDASGANELHAGGSIWQAWLSGTSVRTNAPIGPFTNGGAGDVNTSGSQVYITDYQAGFGITAYTSAGALLGSQAAPLTSDPIRFRGDVVAYHDLTDGWHLWDTSTGNLQNWQRQIQRVYTTVPVGDYVVEQTDQQIIVRPKTVGTGFVPLATPPGYNVDAIEISSGVVRIAWSTDQGESASALVVADVTMATGAFSLGTVVGGVLVFVAQTALTPTQFEVQADGTAISGLYPPQPHEMVDPRTGRISRPWLAWALQLQGGISTLEAMATAAANITIPDLWRAIAVSGQVSLVPTGQDTLTIVGDGVTITTNPALRQLTFTATPAKDQGYWSVLTNGDPDAPQLIFDSFGDVIMVWVPT